MAIITILMVACGLGVALLAARWTGISLQSAVMGTTPGGLSQMVVLSEEIKGAEPTIVTFMQTIRMLTVIFIVPALTFHALSGEDMKNVSAFEQGAGPEPGNNLFYLFVIGAVLLVTKLAVRFNCPTPYIIGQFDISDFYPKRNASPAASTIADHHCSAVPGRLSGDGDKSQPAGELASSPAYFSHIRVINRGMCTGLGLCIAAYLSDFHGDCIFMHCAWRTS
jgi:hypothetical protein